MNRRKKIKTVRVAIIGCGYFGNYHLNNLLNIPDIEIIALYNRGIENLEKTGKKVPKARLYQDAIQLLNKEKIDAVVISLTPDVHGEIEELCCSKGIHMFIEKPLGLDMKTAKKIDGAIRGSNVITSVGYHERYSPPIEIVREILQKEPVGLVQAYWLGGMPGVPWWRMKEQSGGQIVEQSTHLVDLLRYLLGEVDSVYASGMCDPKLISAPHTVEDYSACVLNFKSGAIATLINACYITGDSVGKIGFEIITPRLRIEYRWGKFLRVDSGERMEEVKILKDNHITAIETFIDAVKTGDRLNIKSPYEDAIKSLNVTLMANSSLENKKLVKSN